MLMTLETLFDGLCELLIGDSQIEKHAKSELQRARADTLPPQHCGDWRDMSIEPLISCPAFPTGNRFAYDLVQNIGIKKALSQLTLLRDRDDSNAWSHWHKIAKLDFIPSNSEMLIIPDPNVRVQAVIDGQGSALNDALIQDELDNERLFRLSDKALDNYGYFLAFQPGAYSNPDVEAFATWLKSELHLGVH
jgi:DNA-binding transcriptional LysR family regulator